MCNSTAEVVSGISPPTVSKVNIHTVKLLNWVTAPSGGHNAKTQPNQLSSGGNCFFNFKRA